MKFAKYLTAAAFVACCCNSQPAQASDFVKGLLQQFSGTVVNWDDLESRHHAVEVQIRQAVEAGKISASDADQLRSQLNPVSDAVIQGRASGKPLSFTQGLIYAQTINSVTANLQQAIATKQSALPDVDALQVELSQKIDESLSANQLTADDAARLKGELATVADIESTIKSAGDGSLSAKQVETISGRLSNIKTELVQAIKMGQSAVPELTHRLSELQQRVSGALNAGQISSDQAGHLSGALDHAGAHMRDYLNSSQYLNGSQILEMAGSLDHIASDLQGDIASNQAAAQMANQAAIQAGNQGQDMPINMPPPNQPDMNGTSVTDLSTIHNHGDAMKYAAIQAAQILTIDNVEVAPVGQLAAGDVLTVRAFGTPDASASFSVKDGVQGVPMDERRQGVYEGCYTVRKSDNIGRTRVLVSLRKSGFQPASGESRNELMIDAMPPEILVEPAPNGVTGTQPNVVVNFTDGHGSGIDPSSIHLYINDQDVTGQAVCNNTMIAFRPGQPLFGTIRAEIKVADRCGNAVDYRWTFTAQ